MAVPRVVQSCTQLPEIGQNESEMGKLVTLSSWLKRAVGTGGSDRAGGRSRFRTSVHASLLVLAVLAAAAAVVASVPTRAWIPGMCATLACQLALVSGFLLLFAVVARARISAIILSLATTALLWPSMSAIPRRRVQTPHADSLSISLLITNAYSLNQDPREFLNSLEAQGADIVVITEPPPAILRPLTASIGKGPGTLLRCPPTRGEHSWIVVQTRFPATTTTDPSDGVLDCRIETPQGSIQLIATHLLSPRTSTRNAIAFDQVDRIVDAVDRSAGIPLIIAGDFNATPTSNASCELAHRTNTRRCKPVLRAGTYPAGLPGPLRLGIDDGLVSDQFQLTSWRTVRLQGSDHFAVRMTLEPSTPP